MNSNSKLKADVQEFVPKVYPAQVTHEHNSSLSPNLNKVDYLNMPVRPDPASGLNNEQCYSLFPAKKKRTRSKKSPDKSLLETNFKVAESPTYKVLPRVKNVIETTPVPWPGLAEAEDERIVHKNTKAVNVIPKARSFADMVKTVPRPVETEVAIQDDSNMKKDKNLHKNSRRLEERLKMSRNNTAMTSILMNKNKKQKAVVNQISASTYGRIGKSDDESKYVMSNNNTDVVDKKDRSNVVRHELEVEFKEPDFQFSSDDDFEVEFSASAAQRPGKNVVNKISAMTFQQIGKTSDNEKYVMKPKSWSSVVGRGLKTAPDRNSVSSNMEVPELQAKPKGEPTVHDKIRAKMKENIELTPEEREILRQKRRERRKREKENKKKDKEEEKRKEMLKPQTSKLKFISSNILDQVKQSSISSKDASSKDKGIKFLDEEYPDLGAGQRKSLQSIKKERVISWEIRDENGKLTSDRESNSEWETEDESKVLDPHEASENEAHLNVKIQVVTNSEPISYSSILKTEKKPEVPKAAIIEKPPKASQEKVEEKKKVKKKDPISLDLFSALQVKKQQPKKNAAVLAGKLKKEPIVKAVRNALDSSAPTKKRGKEREGGKKKKKTLMKKIILADREKRRLLREDAEKRREERIKAGVTLKPLPQLEDDFNLVEKEIDDTVINDVKVLDEESHETNIKEVASLVDITKKIQEEITESSSNLKTEQAKAETEAVVKTPLEISTDEKALTAIHSRKFRSYCSHLLSPELDNTISLLMADLVRFQDKQHAKDPVKAKARRRFVVGLREVAKFLKVKKVCCIILAPDIERVETEGGLDDAVSKLIADSNTQEIKTVFALNRRKLGKLCLKKVPVSCIGIMNYQGSDENYKTMLSLVKTLTESYQARFEAEVTKITCPSKPSPRSPPRPQSVLSTTAAAFVPSASLAGGDGYYDYYGNYCEYNNYYDNNYYSNNYYPQDYTYLHDYKQNVIDILRH